MTPDVVIANPYVMLLKSQSLLGLTIGSSQMQFGVVKKVYVTSDKVSINQSWLFDTTQARIVLNGSETYYVVDEKYLIFKENFAPAP